MLITTLKTLQLLITTLMGRGRDHWRRWHGNRFAMAHLKQIISWFVYLRKYFSHLRIWVRWYHCSSERTSMVLQMFPLSFCLTSAHIRWHLWSSAHVRKYLWWCKMSLSSSFHVFCNQVKQNIIAKLAFEVLGLEEGDMGEADYHPLPHHHHNNLHIHYK